MTSMSGAPQGSVASAVTVQTIAGPVDASELGMTLMHEHTTQDLSEALHPGARDFSFQLAGVKNVLGKRWRASVTGASDGVSVRSCGLLPPPVTPRI